MKKERVRWYIAQTYSGQENAVKKDLESRIFSMGMTDYIFEVIVPEEKAMVDSKRTTDGKTTVTKKEKIIQIFPGYVFVKMLMTDESWSVVRNTPKVTGFLGSSGGGTKPTPLLDSEMKPILIRAGLLSKANYTHLIGTDVTITEGPFKGMTAPVVSVDNDNEQLTVHIPVFGRDTPVTLSFNDFSISE